MSEASFYKPLADLDARTAEVAPTYARAVEKRAILDRAVAAVDRSRWAAIKNKYADDLVDYDERGVFKYADLPFWLAHKTDLAFRIGLDRMAPAQILDIGMGAGHFGAVAQALGHRVVGTDIFEPLYEDICALFGVERRILPIARVTPMPTLGQRFDLVTLIWQVFDRRRIRTPQGKSWEWWTLDDWLFLLRDLADDHVRPGGAIFLQLNQQILPEGDRFDPDLMAWAEARGAVKQAETGDLMFADIQPGSGFFTVDGPIPAASPVASPGRLARLLGRARRATRSAAPR
jgi:hypothetical protein